MKCVICKHGETQQGFTTVTLEKNDATIIFKHVPAHVCDNCGEKYVDGEVTAEVLKKAQEIVSNGVQIDIREYQSAA
jgi:YgiT-type zinc finger domain-containing protein